MALGFERLKNFADLFIYIIPYMVFILWIVVLLWLRNKARKKTVIEFFIIISLVIFAGVKEPFTWDLQNYCLMYNYPGTIAKEEVFLTLSVKFLRNFSGNCVLLYVWYQFLTCFFINLSIKNLFPDFYNWSFFIYLMVPSFFINSFGVELRQSLALAVLFFSFTFLLSDRTRGFLLFLLLSASIHLSSLIAAMLILPSYFILKKSLKKHGSKTIFVILFALLILSFLIPYNLLNFSMLKVIVPIQKYRSYLGHFDPVPFVDLLVNNFLSILSLVTLEKTKNQKIIYVCALFSIGVIFLNIFKGYQVVSRIFFYFSIFQIVFIPFLMSKIKPRQISYILFTCFYIFQFIFGLFYLSPYGDYPYLPYKGLIMQFLRKGY